MDRTLPLLLPLTAALLYVFGALLVKRSGDFGVGVWRTAFISNLTSAIIFQLLLPLGGAFPRELLWQPALLGVLFLLAQLLNYLALQRGDVSVATPVLGSIAKSSPVLDCTETSRCRDSTMPLRLKPAWNTRSPVSGRVVAADAGGSCDPWPCP